MTQSSIPLITLNKILASFVKNWRQNKIADPAHFLLDEGAYHFEEIIPSFNEKEWRKSILKKSLS